MKELKNNNRLYISFAIILALAFWVSGFSSARAQVTVHNPSSSTVVEHEQTLSIQYQTYSGTGSMTIEVYKGTSWVRTLVSNYSNPYSYYWEVPSNIGTGSNYRVRVISSTDGSAFSDYFTITEPPHEIDVTSPTSSTTRYAGGTLPVRWNRNYSGGTVKIQLLKGGSVDRTIATSTSNDGAFDWSIPSGLSNGSNYQVRVSENSGSAVDTSPDFTIQQKSIDVTRPESNDSIQEGEVLNIEWSANYSSGSVRIELTKGYQVVKELDIVSVSQNSYSNYTVEDVPSVLSAGSDYRIRISDYSTGSPSAYGPSFEIYGDKITVTGGDNTTVVAGQNHTVSWSQNFSGAVDLHYETSSGGWQSIVTNYNPSTKSRTWTTPSGSNYTSSTRVRIRKSSDHSLRTFAQNISLSKTLSLTSPNSSTDLIEGENLPIRWNTNYSTNPVKLELYKGSTKDRTIASSTANDGALNWNVPSSIENRGDYRVKISDDSGSPSDYSSYFDLSPKWISVDRPLSGTEIDQGRSLLIEWSENYDPSHVKIELLNTSHTPVYEINDSEPNDDGKTNWTVDWPNISSGTYFIKVSDATDGSINGESSSFQIDQYRISVTGGDNTTVEAGRNHTISWSSNLDGGDIELHYEDDDGNWEYIDTVPFDDASYDWTTPSESDYLSSTQVRLRSTIDDTQVFVNNIDLTKTLSLTSPTASTDLVEGDDLQVRWNSNYTDAPDEKVKIELFKGSSSTPEKTLAGSTDNDGELDWMIEPGLSESSDYYVKISDTEGSPVDQSSQFSLAPKTLTVDLPEENEQIQEGEKINTAWTANYDFGSVTIELVRGFEVIKELDTVPVSYGSYDNYTVEDVPDVLQAGVNYKIRISDYSTGTPSAESAPFEIYGDRITVTGGSNTSVVAGQDHFLSWTQNFSGAVDLDYEVSQGVWEPIVTDYDPPEKSLSWTTPSGSSYIPLTKVRIRSSSDPDVQTTVQNITLTKTLSLTGPAGGTTLSEGEDLKIRWNSNYTDAPGEKVNIELYKGSSSSPVKMLSGSNGTDNDGALDWTIEPGLSEGSDYYVKISDAGGSPADQSSSFSISPKSITVNRPFLNESIREGEKLVVEWNASYTSGSVKIELVKGFQVIKALDTVAVHQGSYNNYTVEDIPSVLDPGTDYKIKISDYSTGLPEAFSPPFEISDDRISSADGGNVTVVAGEPHTFSWENNLRNGLVELAYEKDGLWMPLDTVGLHIYSHTWTTPSGADYQPSTRIRIRSMADPNVSALIGNITFDEFYELSFTTLNGTSMEREKPFELEWEHNLNRGSLILEYYDSGTWYPVTTLPWDETSYGWTPPPGIGSNIQVRITATAEPGISDAVSNLYVISPGGQGVAERAISFESYNLMNRPTELIDAAGTRFEYIYGTNDQPLTPSATAGINGAVDVYLTGIRQAEGLLTTTARYNPEGRLDTLINVTGISQSFSYDSLGRLQEIKNNSGEVVEAYTYTFEPNFSNTNPNLVRTERPLDSGSRYITEYIDGLGRPIQTHLRDGSDDIVAATGYDARGREWKAWKPYRQSNSSHEYRSSYAGEAGSYYDGDPGPAYSGNLFAEQLYEASPLGRPSKTIPEGGETNSGAVTTAYEVRPWNNKNWLVTTTTDEDGNETETWTDGWGRTVRTVADPDGINAETLFEYDELDNLTKVTAPNGTETTYTYNAKGELIEKNSADAGTVRYKYDTGGNLRFVQDANRAAAGEVIYTTWDFAGRPLAQGVAGADFSSLDPDSTYGFESNTGTWQGVYAWDEKTTFGEPWERFADELATSTKHTEGQLAARAWRFGGGELAESLTVDGVGVTGEESYQAAGSLEVSNTIVDPGASLTLTSGGTINLQPGFHAEPGSQLSATIDPALTDAAGEGKSTVAGANPWQLELYSYDSEGRLADKWIWTGDKSEWNTHLAYEYNRQGEITKRKVMVAGQTLWQFYEYNQRGLLSKVFINTSDSKPSTAEVTYTYTATGAIDNINYKGNKDADYGYTIRDWVESINNVGSPNGNFAAEYEYATKNGNITKASFFNPEDIELGINHREYWYNFIYDGLNRLTKADYGDEVSGTSDFFDVGNLSYDEAGNIESLRRRDETGSLIDRLRYDYAGNRLTQLEDSSGVAYGWDAASASFGYDANGNLISRTGKLTDVTYDHRNLPTQFALASNDTLIANYNADGQRILKELKDGAWQFYVMDGQQTLAVIKDGTLSHMNLVGNGTFGRWEPGGTKRYYIKDHLGSTRAVVNDVGTVLEAFDYYPFGLLMPKRNTAGANTLEKFTGKERDMEGNLNLDYFGARFYDPALGKWLGVDPLADEYPEWSPYNYTLNNPIIFVDPNGMFVDYYGFDTETGQLSLLKETDDDFDVIYTGRFQKDGIFEKNGESIKVNKGSLQGTFFKDISESGLVFTDLSEGLQTMKFLSFEFHREFSAWAYANSSEEGLAVSPWANNTSSLSLDYYARYKSRPIEQDRVGYLGEKLFNIHTHPGTKDGRGGFGRPGPTGSADLRAIKLNPEYPFYIMSRHHNITRFYPNGSVFTVDDLNKYLKK
ncbi:MAG: Ser-Thr-rich GPI-anchored membrane family protein [Balneolaceae bacterium]